MVGHRKWRKSPQPLSPFSWFSARSSSIDGVLPSNAKDKHVSERNKQTQPGAISRDTSLSYNNLRTEMNYPEYWRVWLKKPSVSWGFRSCNTFFQMGWLEGYFRIKTFAILWKTLKASEGINGNSVFVHLRCSKLSFNKSFFIERGSQFLVHMIDMWWHSVLRSGQSTLFSLPKVKKMNNFNQIRTHTRQDYRLLFWVHPGETYIIGSIASPYSGRCYIFINTPV